MQLCNQLSTIMTHLIATGKLMPVSHGIHVDLTPEVVVLQSAHIGGNMRLCAVQQPQRALCAHTIETLEEWR